MFVRRLELGPLETNCWVVADDLGGPALVIDPAGDAGAILEAVEERTVAAIVLTHKHFDHIGGVRDLIAATGAPLLAHERDAGDLSDPGTTGGAMFGIDFTAPAPDRVLADGNVVEAGALRAIVLHTPGHTPGGICLFVEDPAGAAPHLFSGDTLFAGSVGRTDFAGGSARDLAQSIASKLATLPAETLVHPGHGPDTTIGRERRVNPFWPRA
jgi:glyoxylase-like metal-dependent hydrolase (beta-lactamase superfamily II)